MKKKFDELSPYKIVHHDWQSPYPVHVEIDPTSKCNQNCLRCSYKQDISGKREYIIQEQNIEIPFERFKELIDELSEIGIKAITFSGGGDPLIYHKIDDIIHKITSLGIKFGVITNLSVKKDITEIAKAVWLRVSLDAATDTTYNLIHRPANHKSFAIVLRNIEKLLSLNPELDLGINYLIQPENYSEILAAGRLVKKMGARYIRYVPVIATHALDYKTIMEKSYSLLKESEELIDKNFHVFIVQERFKSLANHRKNYSFCYKQRVHPLIGADGNIYPCCLLKYYKQHALGNIISRSFQQVWSGETRRQWLKNLNVDHCPPCWFDKTNEFMEYLFTESPEHVDFV